MQRLGYAFHQSGADLEVHCIVEREPVPLCYVGCQVLVETFERGDSISRYVEQGPGALHNDELARLGSYALLQVPAL